MILTCPSCSASYNVPNGAIGPDGRAVRCKKCQHEWFQQGEKKALEDLINLIQSTEIEVDDIDFDDDKKNSKITRPVVKKTSLADKVKVLLIKVQNMLPERLKTYLASGDSRSFSSHFAAFMVSLAVFMCLLFVLISARWSITNVMPSLTSAYEVAGFPLTNYSHLNPEESLTIDRLMMQAEGGKHEITGSLINLASQNVKVPTFKVSYLDAEGVMKHESKQKLPIQILEKEAVYNFNILIPEDAPKGFSSIKISFTD